MRLIFNKRADSRLLSIFLFFVLGIIGVGIVLGVLISYSVDVDLKEEEALSLNNKIIGIFVDSGYLNEKIFEEGFDIAETARLKRELFFDDRLFYLKIDLIDGEGNRVKGYPIILGYEGFETECQLPGKNFPKCEKKIISVNRREDSKRYKLEIITGSGQKGSEI